MGGDKLPSSMKRPEHFRGDFILPSDALYNEVRLGWNQDFEDRLPSVVLRPKGPSDVAIAMKWVSQNNYPFAVMGGGHSFSGKSLKHDAVLIRLTHLDQVHVDVKDSSAWVGMGATVKDFDMETNAHNLFGVGGHVSDTGMAGFSCHGGFGCISRRYGLAVDNILAARVVLADGSMLEATEDENTDLLWAIRGAASHIGVVTELKVRLFSLPEANLLYSGQIFWEAKDDELFEQLLSTFIAINETAPDNFAVMSMWANIDAPPFNGQRTFVLHGAWIGDESMAEASAIMAKFLAPILKVAEPIVHLLGPKPYHVYNSMQDPFTPSSKWRCSAYAIPDSNALVEAVMKLEKSRPHATAHGLESWGGRITAGAPEPSQDLVLGCRQRCVLALLGRMVSPESVEPTLEYAQAFKAELGRAGYQSVRYANYAESDVCHESMQRLQAIKAKYDPNNRFPVPAGMVGKQ
eukprot:m.44706 g.44706  ORF g.44706 m.44706 type:complete len:463 (+) comp13042_c0_seq1:39-1427(+)